MLYIDWFNLFFVAVMGASATLSLRTGVLYPFFRDITRKEAPWKYWGWITFCAWVVAGGVGGTLWNAFHNT